MTRMSRQKFSRVACVVALVLLLVGCGQKKTYQVEVRNDTRRPFTLWLTKDGPPTEEGWLAPEDLAASRAERELQYDFQVVEPTRTGYTGKLAGEFPKGTNAVLRVYDGTPNYLDMAKAGAAGRADHVLKPGNNRLRVSEQSGQLVIRPAK